MRFSKKNLALDGGKIESETISGKLVIRKKLCSGQEEKQGTCQQGGKAATDPGAIGTLKGTSGDARQET